MNSLTFDYIGDNKLRDILLRDYKEMEVCLANGATKSVLILAGSIVEAILIDILNHNVPVIGGNENYLKKQLYELIEIAQSERIISSRSKDLLSVLRGYRNLIHPGRELRENEKFDIETAKVSVSLIVIISNEIRNYLIDKFGFSASDIIGKLERDETSAELFRELLMRLSQREKHKLYYLLKEYRPGRKAIQRTLADNTRSLIYQLKPFLTTEFILEQVKGLVEKVHIGESVDILVLYRLWYSDLRLLSDRDRETVVLYVLNYINYNISSWLDKSEYYHEFDSLSTASYYVKSERTVAEFKQLITTLILLHDGRPRIVSLYSNLVDKLSEDTKIEIERSLQTGIPLGIAGGFWEDLVKFREEYDDLPF
ncbi:hypothetical protein SAMN05216327_108161 [Dyadobacter sp. SG02]|uniref:hypothetical protein n=1 Tax=Dyadobacter sp. SG02 TaxID=1855291 RepID=UPI0008B816E1|nr:hypothetical protein [Dyadobacter sp. SG02]SEJ30371.1 hypothetical protein SAMN05216327_108161 [Dyadobacter sp. SG02]